MFSTHSSCCSNGKWVSAHLKFLSNWFESTCILKPGSKHSYLEQASLPNFEMSRWVGIDFRELSGFMQVRYLRELSCYSALYMLCCYLLIHNTYFWDVLSISLGYQLIALDYYLECLWSIFPVLFCFFSHRLPLFI